MPSAIEKSMQPRCLSPAANRRAGQPSPHPWKYTYPPPPCVATTVAAEGATRHERSQYLHFNVGIAGNPQQSRERAEGLADNATTDRARTAQDVSNAPTAPKQHHQYRAMREKLSRIRSHKVAPHPAPARPRRWRPHDPQQRMPLPLNPMTKPSRELRPLCLWAYSDHAVETTWGSAKHS